MYVFISLNCQPYAALKAREYLDKHAIHETMVKVCNITLDITRIT